MYKYVPQSHVTHYKAYCQNILDQLQRKLREEYCVHVHSLLIGSGAANMVTKNGREGLHLDYSLILTAMPRRYDRSPGELKALIKSYLDELITEKCSSGRDTASSITYLIHSLNGKRTEFCFDITLIRQPRGAKNRCMLIYSKENESFIWEMIPASRRQDSKADAIKDSGYWEDVREEYLNKKNTRLHTPGDSRPAFVLYNEAVNQIYYQKIKNSPDNIRELS